MNKQLLVFAIAFLVPSPALADSDVTDGAVVVGVNLGELPWGGSFKPGLTLGYQWNDYVYTGVTYQIGDSIRRDSGSFNASGIGIDGITRSEEDVSGRFMASVRVRPHRLSPYATLGVVYNGRDTETTSYEDGTTVVQSRPGAWRPAIGLGYEHTLDNGISMHVEWAGWVFERPSPDVTVTGGGRTPDEQAALLERIDSNFKSHITNSYHLFSVGVGYAL